MMCQVRQWHKRTCYAQPTASLFDQNADAPQKNEWLPRGSLITLRRGASRFWGHKRIYLLLTSR
jgi:hypothetical protein